MHYGLDVFSVRYRDKINLPAINHGGQEGFAVLIQLFRIYIHFESRFQLDRIMVLKNRNLFEPAPDQGFVEFRQFGGLAADEILKCCDTRSVPS